MNVSSERFDLSQSDKRGIGAFTEYLWHNGEICNECFARVRAIGDEQIVHGDVHRHQINAYYERTEDGSQEHTPFESPADRYGTCFCEDCGAASETGLSDSDSSLDELGEYITRIGRYFIAETPHSVDGTELARVMRRLKQVPENGGYDTEILAVATAHALEPARPANTATVV